MLMIEVKILRRRKRRTRTCTRRTKRRTRTRITRTKKMTIDK